MKKLAIFENYIDDFCVTKQVLLEHGFSKDSTFTAVVAEQDSKLLGYLVYYLIPFTYDLKPTLFIKEFYVNKDSRGKSIGKQLMSFTINDAKEKGCGRMKWDVLSDNIKAQSFYKNCGAKYDARWQGFVLKV
jgi:GNAT superfamily N-acetyltransferase